MAAASADALPFLPAAWDHARDGAPALYDAARGTWIDYGALREKIAALAPALKAPRKSLIFCLAENSASGVIGYLAAAASNHAVAMVDPGLPSLAELTAQYRPEFIIAPAGFAPPDGYRAVDWKSRSGALPVAAPVLMEPDSCLRGNDEAHAIHPGLFLLLPTSGSTGGRKFVRLSYRNIAANTASIIASLDLTATALAFLHLPLSYSFGLSILHTQLATGGGVIATGLGMMERGFWDLARQAEATLFPGVPYHYEMLARLGLARLDLPKLNMFLQAGGKLSAGLTAPLGRDIAARGGAFYIMYGQTEAAPRMTCFAAHRHPDKIGSAGPAIPGGRITIEDGEIVYRGGNVMMGYAAQRSDLALGDTQQGVLHTGDLGALDSDGFLTITGRKQRFAKLYGLRIALDEIERLLRPMAQVAVWEGGNRIMIATTADADVQAAMKTCLQEKTSIQPAWIAMKTVPEFSYLPNGKLDYRRLMGLAENR